MKKLSDDALFNALKILLINEFGDERIAEGIARVVVEARNEGIIDFCMGPDGLEVWLVAKSKEEALDKLFQWTVKHHMLGHIDDLTYRFMMWRMNQLAENLE